MTVQYKIHMHVIDVWKCLRSYVPAAKAMEKNERSREAKTGKVKVVIFEGSGSCERSRELACERFQGSVIGESRRSYIEWKKTKTMMMRIEEEGSGVSGKNGGRGSTSEWQ